MDTAVNLSCSYCKMTFTTEESANAHFKTKKHLRMENNIKCGVFITGFDKTHNKEDIWRYFSEYGAKKKPNFKPKHNYMVLDFENQEQVEKVLSTQHIFGGRQLRLRKYFPPSNTSYESSVQDDTHEKLLESLKDFANFDNQVNQFMHLVIPDLRDILMTYNLVNQDVFAALSPLFPSCFIFNFGSSTSCLQFKTSDLDIYLEIGDSGTNHRRCLREIKNALTRSRKFSNIIEIASARVPIVRATHIDTGMKCDINFKTMAGVENSKAIRFYLSLDPKLRPAMLIIKYWAKVQEISGRCHLFTSYSLVMMFIFYLQRCHKFPSFFELQRNTAPTIPRVIWNLNINPTVVNMNKIKEIQSKTLLEVLKGFFEFYSTFNFQSDVICPFLGRTVKKESFSNVKTVPDQFFLYKRNIEVIKPLQYEKAVCLQDPFELDTNICRGILYNVLKRYVEGCEDAFEILSSDKQDMLIRLFTLRNVKDVPEKKKLERTDPDRYNFVLKKPEVVKYLRLAPNADLTESWFQHTVEYCCTVLEKVFKLDLKPKDNAKSARVGSQQDVHDCDEVKKFCGEAFVNLWDCRNLNPKEIAEELKACKTSLERDIVLSDYVWAKNVAIKPNTPLIRIEVVLTYLKESDGVNVEIVRLHSYKKMFKGFANFLIHKVPQWFEKYVKELNEQLENE